MQKFRDYIYCDKGKLQSCVNQIEEFSTTEISEFHETSSQIDGGIDFKVANAGAKVDYKKSTTFSINKNETEKFVSWVFNKDNAINYEGEDLNEYEKDHLIVFSGIIKIPEMVEKIEFMNSVMKNNTLVNLISLDKESIEKMSYIKESDEIPVLVELDSNYLFTLNLKSNCIIGDRDDLFDNFESEVTIIGKIDRIYNSEERIEIYDLARGIFKINRAIRRQIPKEKLKDAIVYEDGPLVKVTPIIIYN